MLAELDKEEKSKIEIEREKLHETERQFFLNLLLDIRMIQLYKLPLSKEEFQKFFRSLPSQEGRKEETPVDYGVATVTMLKPGEIPEWKKKLQAKQQEKQKNKT